MFDHFYLFNLLYGIEFIRKIYIYIIFGVCVCVVKAACDSSISVKGLIHPLPFKNTNTHTVYIKRHTHSTSSWTSVNNFPAVLDLSMTLTHMLCSHSPMPSFLRKAHGLHPKTRKVWRDMHCPMCFLFTQYLCVSYVLNTSPLHKSMIQLIGAGLCAKSWCNQGLKNTCTVTNWKPVAGN